MNKSKEEKIKSFDFDGLLTLDKNIFGLPFNAEESEIVIIPVPWDVTVSYNDGTSNAPEAIKIASTQLDLYDLEYQNPWKAGIFMEDVSDYWKSENKKLRKLSKEYINYLSSGKDLNDKPEMKNMLMQINEACNNLNKWVEEKATHYLNKGKIVCVLGGDHSSPLGLIRALSKKHKSFSILQIDAHADLRIAFEGFEFSHASAMNNAIKLETIESLVQVGIRDIGHQEMTLIKNSQERIHTFFDIEIKNKIFKGDTWYNIVEEIVSLLNDNVYISFDIDGLEPYLCPNTGTPVPGGLSFNEITYLLQRLVAHNKQIIGFDLCEVSPSDNEWDANVGARILYKLCAVAALSNKFK